GQLDGQEPTARRLLKQLQLRVPHEVIAQLADRLRRPPRIAGLEQSADLGEAQTGQGLAEPLGGAISHLKLLGPQQIVPGGGRVVVLELPFAALDVELRQLPQQFAMPTVSLERLLFEEALRLLQTPVVERLLHLTQRQPAEEEHRGSRIRKRST